MHDIFFKTIRSLEKSDDLFVYCYEYGRRFIYNTVIERIDRVATVKNNRIYDENCYHGGGRLILKNGHIIDPASKLNGEYDIAIISDRIMESGTNIKAEKGDRIIDCEGLYVFPGLIDMHLHQGDLYELNFNPITEAVCDGITFAFTPGAGNTFMTPALLGAEIDRGLPINIGCYLSTASVFGTSMSDEELTKLFSGNIEDKILSSKLTRNSITNSTAPLILGFKDHCAHYISDDNTIKRGLSIAYKSKIMYISHINEPEHIIRMKNLSDGMPFHLCHASAIASGIYFDPVDSMKVLLDSVGNNITAEFMTSNMRYSRGNRESVKISKAAQQMAWDALAEGKVNIMVSDGQRNATMKGGSSTSDNLAAIFEISNMGILSLEDAVATMTSNVSELFARRTDCKWWIENTGNLKAGALANIVIVEPNEHRAVMTICNGNIVAFEGHIVPRGIGAGYWICKYGSVPRMGVGDLTMFSIKR